MSREDLLAAIQTLPRAPKALKAAAPAHVAAGWYDNLLDRDPAEAARIVIRSERAHAQPRLFRLGY